MHPMSRHLRALVAAGAVVLLVDGCSDSSAPAASTTPSSSAPATTSSDAQSPKQHYLATVNALCDQLLPKVIRATHGGSLDIAAGQYLKDWPAHQGVLKAFDKSLAAVPVPAAAAPAAAAMRHYVTFADGLDAARLKAAGQGERAWRHEVAAEANVENDPAIAARNAAGFAASCDAR
ncbi:MAG TPA: hypothetical protein VH085_06260 [Nocardioides sp.]|jgi:hypothetical protein|nr:hypothetical protein [Nocardioides sp.]